ncbi:MAG: hypothetical protein PHY43_05735 [Verrucomicrobiales bacterium]|nr:hypothetical protein [Verrucomicrobiales bacterium]
MSCPSCGKQTRLLLPTKPAAKSTTPKLKFSRRDKAILVVALVMAPILAWKLYDLRVRGITQSLAPFELPNLTSTTKGQPRQASLPKQQPLSAEEKTSRENILKALLEVQSATAVGVTRDRYGGLLIKADSTLNFEKTKLSDDRHYQYSSHARDAIRFYSKANGAWDSYFKYDWMREKHEALMFEWDFKDLHDCGVSFNEKDYPLQSDATNARIVPFDECLSLYWKGADIFIEKMKAELSL